MTLGRREFVVSLATAAIAHRSDAAAETIDLWPGSPPGGGGPVGHIDTSANGAVSNVARPTLQAFLPERPTGGAVLVAGGGGYKRIEQAHEAVPAAQWLRARGVAAFVLTYRLPGEGWNDGPAVAVQDAQRALRVIRAGALRLRIDPSRIGVLGFSAGGHLLGLASARSAWASYTPVDDLDGLPARPASAALAYPVITLRPPYDDTSTRRILVGTHPDLAAETAWSVETHVHPGCPPIFLTQAEDDPVSNPQNTLIMTAACQRAGVAVDMHRFATGGHGFGMGRPGTPTTAWPRFYEAWLRGQGFLPA